MNRVLIALLSTLIVFSACQKKSQEYSTVGVVGPFTGEGATYGQSMRRGFDLAFQSDSTIKLVYEDDQLDPKQGVNAITKLIGSHQVQVVLGSAASGVTLAMSPIAEKNKVILFSSISTSDRIRESGDYIFRNVPRNEIQGKSAAEFLFSQLHKTKAAVLNKNDEYGTNLAKSFKERFAELGGTIVFEDSYQPQTSDFRAIIVKIKSSGAEAVFTPGNYQETASLLKQAKESRLQTVFIGGDGSYSPELINIAGSSADGSYYTLMTAEKEDEYYKRFLETFMLRYQKEPDIYDAYAYEAGKIILEAIQKAGYDADKIKQYLYSTTFTSLTGQLKFDKDGEVARNYGIIVVKDGKFEEAK